MNASKAGFGVQSKTAPMGVLYTGYLKKTNPDNYIDSPKKRFVVLTHVGLHWFKVGTSWVIESRLGGNA